MDPALAKRFATVMSSREMAVPPSSESPAQRQARQDAAEVKKVKARLPVLKLDERYRVEE